MRYVNPHAGQPVMMQPQHQPMMPQNQQVGPTVIITQQGPMLVTPQGLVPVQVQNQQNMTPQQMQSMMPVQQPMMVQQPMQYPSQFVNQPFSSNNQSVVPQSRFGQPFLMFGFIKIADMSDISGVA